ncbi:MAG: NEW3 domain-containing protein, partial [Acidimicrobiia bacterium]
MSPMMPTGRFLPLFRQTVVVFLFGFVLLAAASPGFSQSPSPPAPGKEAGELTHALGALSARYQQGRPAERSGLLHDMLRVAAERHQLLATMIEDNPGEVLRLALPEAERAGMPATVQALLERREEIEGELEALYEDYEDGHHRLHYYLKTDSGERLSLHFAGGLPKWMSGTQVRISGVIFPQDSASSGEGGVVLAHCCGSEGLEPLATQGLTRTIGEQRTLVLLVNFQDTATEEPFTIEEARQAVLGTVNDYYREASFGQTWLTGDVYGWFTLPFGSTCNTIDIGNAADEAAETAGIDLSPYGRFIYIVKGSVGCTWAGVSTFGPYPSKAWINGSLDSKITAHELGHGLGLAHSNFLDCGDTVLGPGCITAEDDKFDSMSSSPPIGHFNAFQKERLGWFLPGDVVTVTADGTYTLQPYELSGGVSPKALKVLKNTDPTTGSATWYYLEFRQALGFDAFIAGNNNVLNGVLVHTGEDSDAYSSLLLDMTPNSQLLTGWDREDPALEVGASFTDPDTGVTLTTLSATETGIQMHVSVGDAPCVHADPTVSVSPAASQGVGPGTPVGFQVTITNKDSAACSATSFTVVVNAPSGWSSSIDTPYVTIEPGNSGVATVTITSPTSAPDGFYNIEMLAQNLDSPDYAGSASATYVV